MFPLSRASLLVLLACLLLPGTALAAPGDLDTRFGFEGTALFSVDDVEGSSPYQETAAFPVDAGRTLLVATVYGPELTPGHGQVPRIGLLRLTADGEVDETYGDEGVVLLPVAAGNDLVEAVELPGGDLAVLGNGASDASTSGFGVTRVGKDGAVVTSFGDDGTIVAGFADFASHACPLPPNGGCGASAAALELHGADHLLVAARYASDNDHYDGMRGFEQAILARYDLNGDLDLGFGDDDGTAELATPDGYVSWSRIMDLATEPLSGRILVAEELLENATAERATVHRFDADGAPDTSFGPAEHPGTAIVRFDPGAPDQATVGERPEAIVALPDNGFILAGRSYRSNSEHYGAIARVAHDGEPVDGFGTDGVVLAAQAPGDNGIHRLDVLDGDLYAFGTTRPWGELGPSDVSRAWMLRLDEDGLDTAFGDDGMAVGGQMAAVSGVARSTDGFAVATGIYAYSSDRDLAATRFDLQDERQPVNASRPGISPTGFVAADDVLTASDGTWHYDHGVTRKWQRCEEDRAAETPAAGDCADIPSATGATYTVQAADAGKRLRVVETAASGSLTTTAASETVEFYVPPTPPAFTSTPQVEPSGSVPAGTTVRATWTATGATMSQVYWYRCTTATTGCAPVPADDVDDDSYDTTAGDAGSYLRAQVWISGPGGFLPAAETANATQVTAAGGAVAPVATAAPAIQPGGSAVEGTTLSVASNGTWNQSGLGFTYRWERCDGACAAIPGAGGTSYVTSAADAGKSVRVRVDARQGAGPVGTAVSPVTAITAKPAPAPAPAATIPPPAPPAPPAPKAVSNPFGLKGTVVTQDTTNTKVMPDVRGLQVDAAKQKIEAAGIYAAVDVREAIRAKPLVLPGKPRLDIGDVSSQSIAAGARVTSAVGAPQAVRLVTEAGPKAAQANGGPSGPVCTGAAARDDLKQLGLGEVLDLLRAKGCSRVEVDFTVSASAREVEVRRATKDGKDLLLQVTVPKDPKAMDLTPVFRQGAFNGNPSFGENDWALTAGVMNVLGVQTINRAGKTVDGAEVFLDARAVDAADVDGAARGGIFVTGFKPGKAGTVNVLVVQRDAAGNRIFGFGRITVADRSRAFTAIDGRRYTASGSPAGSGAATARAAGLSEFFGAIGKLAQDLGAGIARMFSGNVSEQTISSAARQNVGLVQISLGDILSGRAGVVSAGGANVVAAGGANVVSAGGANVVSAGGANVVSAGGGNAISLASGRVVAAGGGNLGAESIKNGTGSLMPIPAAVVAAGGGNVVSVGGGNLISDNGLGVVAAGGGNMMSVRTGG